MKETMLVFIYDTLDFKDGTLCIKNLRIATQDATF